MHLLDHTTLGVAILVALVILVAAKRFGTGSVLDKPTGNILIQLVNLFNLFFLLVVNPLAALLLIGGALPAMDPTYLPVRDSTVLMILEISGLCLYSLGCFLMMGALVTLGRNYQLGGSVPRGEDKMIINGPYRLVRHPMYTSALSIALGLTCLIQSCALFIVFCIYLLLILALIPVEEKGLRRAYGGQYDAYAREVRKLIPFIY